MIKGEKSYIEYKRKLYGDVSLAENEDNTITATLHDGTKVEITKEQIQKFENEKKT